MCDDVIDPVIMLAVQPSVDLQHSGESTDDNLMCDTTKLCANQVMQNTKTAYKYLM